MTNPLRVAVMDAMDDFVERSDGSSPDHLLVSRPIWDEMRDSDRFERLRNPASPPRRLSQSGLPYDHRYGYFGMRVWPCSMDEEEHDIVLVAEPLFSEAFNRVMSQPSDWADQS
jgi:hypothetical protein